MSIPDIETVMATRPCPGYPRERVERVLASCGHPRTWVKFAERVRDRGWEAAGYTGVSLYDLLITACRAATPAQRRRAVVRWTHRRVGEQVHRWPEVTPDVADVRRRLLAWQGDEAEIRAIRDAADATYAAYADAAAAADATYAAYADAAADAAAAAYADAPCAKWEGLLFICRLLDGTEAAP